ncbi:Protein CBG22578 [Caenorhabditis briggsae]|uniref:Protein CBG22578 n=1 Tax=Caenorhabditis briggsae TaxID=6238 RepID=A8Y2M3_CAEBR|nr:Protein CBG22578 [Caenorhabditis briggsae]CAP39147.2 Protein CBG22578 [Caenorhabditis briggsae]
MCEKMEKLKLPIDKLKVNIGIESIEVVIFCREYPMEIKYQGKEYKACDIFFLMKHPDLKLKKLAFRIAEYDRFIDVTMQTLIEFNFEKVYETEQWKKAFLFEDYNGLVSKDWANLVHFETISLKSLDQNDLRNLLNYIPKKATFKVVVDNLEIEDVKAVFRNSGKFDKNPESPEFDFPFKFYRELGDGRVLVRKQN